MLVALTGIYRALWAFQRSHDSTAFELGHVKLYKGPAANINFECLIPVDDQSNDRAPAQPTHFLVNRFSAWVPPPIYADRRSGPDAVAASAVRLSRWAPLPCPPFLLPTCLSRALPRSLRTFKRLPPPGRVRSRLNDGSGWRERGTEHSADRQHTHRALTPNRLRCSES
jgi:hypothetical protein